VLYFNVQVQRAFTSVELATVSVGALKGCMLRASIYTYHEILLDFRSCPPHVLFPLVFVSVAVRVTRTSLVLACVQCAVTLVRLFLFRLLHLLVLKFGLLD
jgi:hypothetical protein